MFIPSSQTPLPCGREYLLGRSDGVPGQELDHGLADAVEIGAELLQHLGGDTLALADEAEQDVFRADVVVSELERSGSESSRTFLARGVKGM